MNPTVGQENSHVFAAPSERKPGGNVKEAIEFLQSLDPDGRHCLAAKKPKKRGGWVYKVFEPGDWAAMHRWLDHYQGLCDLYFVGNEPNATLKGLGPTRADIGTIRVIGADWDLEKGIPFAEARKRVADKTTEIEAHDTCYHTYLIDSGGGRQVIWKLDEKLPNTPENEARVESQALAIAKKTGADESVVETNQLYRLPGTVNIGSEKKFLNNPGRGPRPARLIEEAGQSISLKELAEWAPPIEQSIRERRDNPIESWAPNDDVGVRIGKEAARAYLKGKSTPEAISEAQGNNTTKTVLNRVLDFTDSVESAAEVFLEEDGYNDTRTGGEPWDHEHIRDWLARLARNSRERPIGIEHPEVKPLVEFQDLKSADEVKAAIARNRGEKRQKDEAATDQEPKKDAQKLRALTSHSFADYAKVDTSPNYVIKRLIDAETSVLLCGDTNIGKSFVSLHIAYHVARGRSYQGRRVRKGLVVYLALEGGHGIKKRLAALKREYPLEPGEVVPLEIITDKFSLHKLGEAKALIAHIQALEAQYGLPCALVHVDTLNRAIPGAKEDDATLSAVQSNVDQIRRDTKAAVLVVHHTGWTGDHFRGHSSLPFGADTWLTLKMDKKHRSKVMITGKVRDGKKDEVFPFRLKVIDLGKDDEGDPITSCVVEWAAGVNEFAEPGAAAPLSELTPAAAEMWAAFEIAAKEATGDGGEWRKTVIDTDQWETALFGMKADDFNCAPDEIRKKRGYSQRSLRRYRQEVFDQGYVKELSPREWVAEPATLKQNITSAAKSANGHFGHEGSAANAAKSANANGQQREMPIK